MGFTPTISNQQISVIMFAKKLVICMLVAFVAIAVSTRHQESPETLPVDDESADEMTMNEHGDVQELPDETETAETEMTQLPWFLRKVHARHRPKPKYSDVLGSDGRHSTVSTGGKVHGKDRIDKSSSGWFGGRGGRPFDRTPCREYKGDYSAHSRCMRHFYSGKKSSDVNVNWRTSTISPMQSDPCEDWKNSPYYSKCKHNKRL